MAMGTPGVTPANTLQSQPASFKRPVLFNRFNAILRTGRRKPATCSKQR